MVIFIQHALQLILSRIILGIIGTARIRELFQTNRTSNFAKVNKVNTSNRSPVFFVCGLGGWGSGCVGRVGPIKDSLTYRPSSQGWASRVLPLICNVCVFGV